MRLANLGNSIDVFVLQELPGLLFAGLREQTQLRILRRVQGVTQGAGEREREGWREREREREREGERESVCVCVCVGEGGTINGESDSIQVFR